MKRIATSHFPVKRQQDLVIEELPDEVLVYDLERHQAHCLNLTAGLVWKNCDGRTAPREIARRLERVLQASCPEDVVWIALRELESRHLLEQPIMLPAQLAGISRRQLMRTLGIAAVVAVPLVTTMVSPTAEAAGSCVPHNNSCVVNVNCCAPFICNGSTCV